MTESKGWGLAWRAAPWLLAAAAGALWAWPFGIEPQVVAPWLALVPLLLLLGVGRIRTAFGLGWVHGTVFWLVSIPWIAPTLETFGHLAPALALLLLLALALYLGLYTALFAAGGALVWRRLPWPAALLGLPALWVALEWLRGWLLTGFPWNLAGYAWTEVAGALPLAAWIGVWGVSYVALFANCGLALALRALRSDRADAWRPALAGVLAPLLLLALAARFAVPPGPDTGWAEGRADGHWVELGGRASRVNGGPVRIVQPATYNQVEYDPETTRRDYARLIRMTGEACDRPGALIVWPESAAWPFELERDPLLAQDVERFAERGCSILLNSTRRQQGDGGAIGEPPIYYNSAYLVPAVSSPVRPSAPGAVPGTAGVGAAVRYDKRHLVPFGEYVPLAGVFSFLDHLARNAGAYTAAEEITLLPWRHPDPERGPEAEREERLGMAICFEVTFPGDVAELVQAGATILVTLTNDAWYGDTAAPRQHFQAARWRAAETGRPLLRAAITGISAVVAPDGTVRQSLGVGDDGILWSRVAGRTRTTLFVRAPWAVPTAAALFAAFAIIAAARRSTP